MKFFQLFIISILLPETMAAQVYPPPSGIYYDNGTLTIYPPDSVPEYTGGLLSYNIYLDNEFVDNLPASPPEDTMSMVFDPLPLPGYRTFCATANYLNWISDFTCDTVFVCNGYELPFTEDWSTGSFETNNWTQEGDYWIISNETGEPISSAQFHPSSSITDYFVPLTSYGMVADTIPLQYVLVEFDVKLESNNNTGNENLLLQYWRWSSQTWYSINCGGFTNEDGSFDWKHVRCSMTALNSGPFLIRFVAQGENSSDISGWNIDNIHVFQDCGSVSDLTTTITEEDEIELEWHLVSSCSDCWWCWMVLFQWGIDFTNSIGTGSEAVFDVAARWTPEMLGEYDGDFITAVRFFPAEAQATYSIRIWEGDSANLVYEQEVANPVISNWNEVCLDSIHPIDISQSMWIGYHIETMTGYPAAVDWGPANNGYGNLMYWNGQWSTLLEINPDLDYNWLIEAFPGQGYPKDCENRIYKKVGEGEYELIAKVPADEFNEYFTDEDVDLTQTNCYKVTNYARQYLDTCESGQYSESCLLPVSISEKENDNQLMVYPNPAEDYLFIEISENIMEVQLLDMTGRVAYEINNTTDQIMIKVDDFSAGIYLLKVRLKDGLIFRKILIK